MSTHIDSLELQEPKPAPQESLGVDLALGAPDQFPIQLFPETLRKVTEELAAVYQLPVCLPAMAALALLSGAVGKSAVVTGAYKDRQTRLNIFVVGVAERGVGKGVTNGILAEPLMKKSAEMAERHKQRVAARRAELNVLKKESFKLEQQAGTLRGAERAQVFDELTSKNARVTELETEAEKDITLWIDNATSEATVRALADNDETMLSCSAEAGSAVSVSLGKYTDQSDFDPLLTGYSGDASRTNRINRKAVQLRNPCLSLLWLVQGCIMRRIAADKASLERGLTARMMIFDSGARREYDDRKSHKFTQTEFWSDFIAQTIDRRFAIAQPRELHCNSEAVEALAQFHDESIKIEREHYADISGEFSRWRENAIKVAGLFAVAEKKSSIDADLAMRATSVVRWAFTNYLGILQAGRKERWQKEAEQVFAILALHNGEIGLGPLAQSHGINRQRVDALLSAFPETFVIEERPQPAGKPGRPAQIFTTRKATAFGNKIDKIEKLNGGITAA